MKRGGASKRRRLILLLSVGWVPPYLHPSGACLNRGTSIPVGSLHAAEGYTKPGLRLFSCPLVHLCNGFPTRTGSQTWSMGLDRVLGTPSPWVSYTDGVSQTVSRTLQGQRDLLGNSPHKADQFPCDGPGHDMRVFALSHQALGAFAAPHLGLPTDVLDDLRLVFEA